MTAYLITDPPPWRCTMRRVPTVGRYYFGIHQDGSTGALAKWTGYAFENSETDDVDMSIYHHLQEQPSRA